jgi:hypothetical protein
MTQEALKLALEALEEAWYHVGTFQPTEKAIDLYDEARTAIKEALAQEQECWCTTCRPITMADMRFVVCPDCDNKRCPKANDHRNACTNSNEVGQKGSSWEHVKPLAQPEQEPVAWMHIQGRHKEPSHWPLDDGEISRGWEQYPLYTTPPQRTWVGLTDEEYAELAEEFGPFPINQIEAKLKEKNT